MSPTLFRLEADLHGIDMTGSRLSSLVEAVQA
jgi:hypothetical protein